MGMKNGITKLVSTFLFFLTLSVYGQEKPSMAAFENDFEKATDKSFSEKELNKMFGDCWTLATILDSTAIRLSKNADSTKNITIPFWKFKNSETYLKNIDFFLQSSNPNHRHLAYMAIAGSRDLSKEGILLKRLKDEKEKSRKMWLGLSLLFLGSNHTTELFDFVVQNQGIDGLSIIPFYFNLDRDSLQQTAYQKIGSDDTDSKIVAAQALSVTKLNDKTAYLLKQAVQNWDIDFKGYAIDAIKELQMGDLLAILEPLLNNQKTRTVSLEALANSPTKADNDYLQKLIEKQNTIEIELLRCLANSKNIANVRQWLRFLYTKKIPQNYYFSVYEQPSIKSDSLLVDLQTTLQKITDKNILRQLVTALGGRTDDKSIEIFKLFLKHSSPSVRYATARTIEHNQSNGLTTPKILEMIKEGLADGNTPDD
jgi:hypothetical protein